MVSDTHKNIDYIFLGRSAMPTTSIAIAVAGPEVAELREGANAQPARPSAWPRQQEDASVVLSSLLGTHVGWSMMLSLM